MDRFWDKVLVLGPYECWPWTARCLPSGYGRFGTGGYAHRTSYELTYGLLPKGARVRHACDHPWCQNPGHLIAGSAQDNSSDMVNRRRHRYGEGHYNAKLTRMEVDAIRSSQDPIPELAKLYGISKSHAYDIKAHRVWCI